MKTNILISVFAAGLLICGIPDVKSGDALLAPTAPIASPAQKAATATIASLSITNAAPVAARAPINPNMPDNDYYTNGGSRYYANTNSLYWTANPTGQRYISPDGKDTNDRSGYYRNTNSLYWTANPTNGNPVSGYTNSSIYSRH